MPQGRLRLINGFSVNCSYELGADRNGPGRIGLFSALFTAIGEGDAATLVLSDGSERQIRLLQRLGTDDASFQFSGEEPA